MHPLGLSLGMLYAEIKGEHITADVVFKKVIETWDRPHTTAGNSPRGRPRRHGGVSNFASKNWNEAGAT